MSVDSIALELARDAIGAASASENRRAKIESNGLSISVTISVQKHYYTVETTTAPISGGCAATVAGTYTAERVAYFRDHLYLIIRAILMQTI